MKTWKFLLRLKKLWNSNMSTNAADNSSYNKEIRLNKETDTLKYTIFPVILNEDFLSLAEGSGARNFFLFLNPVNPNCGFPIYDAQTLKNFFDNSFGENDFEVRYNRNKAIVVKTNNAKLVRDLLNATDFLNTPISVKLVTDNLTTRFLIKQVPIELAICDLVTFVETHNNLKILAARRLFWEGSPSKTVIVTIPGQQSPQNITFDDLNCSVETFYEKPRQCKKCFQYGHVQNNCSADALCGNCGEVLSPSSSDQKDLSHDNCSILKCLHCQGRHKSNDKHCVEYFIQNQIVKISKENKIPFFEAKRIFYTSRGSFNFPHYSTFNQVPFSAIFSQEASINHKGKDENFRKELQEDIKSEIKLLISEFFDEQNKKFDDLKKEVIERINSEFLAQENLKIEKIASLCGSQDKKIEQTDKEIQDLKKDIDLIKTDYVSEKVRGVCEEDLRKRFNLALKEQNELLNKSLKEFQASVDRKLRDFESRACFMPRTGKFLNSKELGSLDS